MHPLMKILLISALYPPDIADTARSVKELAQRLRAQHTISILTYGHIPEAIPDVHIITIQKKLRTLIRLIRFTHALWKYGRTVDVIYAVNGPSIELPLIFTSYFIRTPVVLYLGDERALCLTMTHPLLKVLLTSAIRASSKIISDSNASCVHVYTKSLPDKKNIVCHTPLLRPEILPFSILPPDALTLYEDSWNKYIALLNKTIFI